jgi:hypothetical protein
MATIDQVGYKKITANEEAAKEAIGYKGIVQFQPTAASGFVPYPNPRYAMAGGMQTNNGGLQ